MDKVFSLEQVAQHNKADDLWVVIDDSVYDLSRFAKFHPGGLAALLDEEIAGQDATEAFYSLHRSEVLQNPVYAKLKIGRVVEALDTQKSTSALSKVPYGEPTWLSDGFKSPYYKDHHRRFQTAFRKFVQDVVYPDAQAREVDGKPPSRTVVDAMARLNIIAMRVGVGKHLEGRVLMDGVITPQEFDPFCEVIMSQELARIHARGYNDGLCGGSFISLPLVIRYAKPAIRDRVVPEVLGGKKFSCLAVTEAYAGSDVAGLKCAAQRVPGGWLVNGSKKWITNAVWADYFITACKTDKGLIVLLIERCAGVETKPISTLYSAAAGTAFVTFTDVRVPEENILCDENQGLTGVLSNFNHERWMMNAGLIGSMRAVTEECIKWTVLRKAFGKPLSSQAVIRNKLAAMISSVESCQNWLENVTYQMTCMDPKKQQAYLAGQIAFLKMHTSRAAQRIAADAVQVFGGRGITRTGMGRYIEHFHRTLLIDAVGGGAEDILGDLGVRQALRSMPVEARL